MAAWGRHIVCVVNNSQVNVLQQYWILLIYVHGLNLKLLSRACERERPWCVLIEVVVL